MTSISRLIFWINFFAFYFSRRLRRRTECEDGVSELQPQIQLTRTPPKAMPQIQLTRTPPKAMKPSKSESVLKHIKNNKKLLVGEYRNHRNSDFAMSMTSTQQKSNFLSLLVSWGYLCCVMEKKRELKYLSRLRALYFCPLTFTYLDYNLTSH